jgi:hypothetical protein
LLCADLNEYLLAGNFIAQALKKYFTLFQLGDSCKLDKPEKYVKPISNQCSCNPPMRPDKDSRQHQANGNQYHPPLLLDDTRQCQFDVFCGFKLVFPGFYDHYSEVMGFLGLQIYTELVKYEAKLKYNLCFQAHVQAFNRMCKRANGDKVHACFCNFYDIGFGDTA